MTNTSTTSAAAYVDAYVTGNNVAMRPAYEAILQWLAHEFEQDGYTAEQIDAMDLESAANALIEREHASRDEAGFNSAHEARTDREKADDGKFLDGI